ncbi:MAG: UDP-N-acetylmuramate--L-alanine ligase [Armatimonadota bacterium]
MEFALHYHLIGIGGAGMSAIAHVLHKRGESVSGSDRQENDATRRLQSAGVKVSIGHSEAHINGADVVVYSAAISKDNSEMLKAAQLGLEMLERPAMLGRLMEPYAHRVAVSGTHGKTTTTSMINSILECTGLDANVLIGGDVKSLGGNVRIGNGSVFVTEACEAFSSFLHLYPSIAVITNIDADHLDHYGTVERVEETFGKFVGQVDEDGCVIACGDDDRVRRVLDGCGRRVVWFGTSGSLDILAADVDVSKPEPTYVIVRGGKTLGEITMGVPGIQNVLDSLAAAGVAFELGADFDAVRTGLRDFKGAGRRWEIMYDKDGITVVDDYAHHPAEIKATLSGARAAHPARHIIAVFQPHLYSRTKAFVSEFAEALSIADEVVVSSIYAAREQPIEGVSAESIVDKMRANGFSDVRYAPDKDDIALELAGRVKSGDLVIVLGAGDIRTVSERLAVALSERDA